MLKKAWKIVLAVVLALLVVVLGYVAYVFIDYHRIGDQELTVERNAAATVEAGKEYGILSYNIGFGAYEDDYSFFMDGGTGRFCSSRMPTCTCCRRWTGTPPAVTTWMRPPC